MSDYNLSKEEKEILNAFEMDEFKSVLTPKRKKYLQAVAEETFKKDKRINIRISSRDLESLQRRALEEGIPYQTLASSGLHDVMANEPFKYVAPAGWLHRTQKGCSLLGRLTQTLDVMNLTGSQAS